jgi:hypothetical protein
VGRTSLKRRPHVGAVISWSITVIPCVRRSAYGRGARAAPKDTFSGMGSKKKKGRGRKRAQQRSREAYEQDLRAQARERELAALG